MSAPLIAVLDETGTTNCPRNEIDSDFAVGIVVCEESDVSKIADASKKIGVAAGKTDYKYKHVQATTEARRLLLSTINSLRPPCGVFGFYAAGGAQLHEKHEAIKEMAFLKSDDGGYTASLAERLIANEKGLHIGEFIGQTACCLAWYSRLTKRPIRLLIDDRSDLDSLTGRVQESLAMLADFPHIATSAQSVTIGRASGVYNGVARVAGTVAGDIRFFFQKHGSKIWDRLTDHVRVSDPNVVFRIMDGHYDPFIVARVSEALADPDFSAGSKDTCMLQGYTKRLLTAKLSFASKNGKLGHINIVRGNEWFITQIPD